jgi:hypothetical protein
MALFLLGMLASPGAKADDPLGRMCYELRRQGICSDVCKIFPPGCISAEEAAHRRLCAIYNKQGTHDEKCRPIVLPKPLGAPDENLAIAAKMTAWNVAYWNLWSTCKGCGWSMDEVILEPDHTHRSYLHSSGIAIGKGGLTLGTLDANGWQAYITTSGSRARFVFFNPKLCPPGESCRAAKNVIVVDDRGAQESRIYHSFTDFAKAEQDGFTCEISDKGVADCKF